MYTCTRTVSKPLFKNVGIKWISRWVRVSPWESRKRSPVHSSVLRVFFLAAGPQRMRNNRAAASQSALRTTRHGAGPHGHPPGPSAAHLHGESVTGHPAVSGSEMSIKRRGGGLTAVCDAEDRQPNITLFYYIIPHTVLEEHLDEQLLLDYK